jgi:hypothetical protein
MGDGELDLWGQAYETSDGIASRQRYQNFWGKHTNLRWNSLASGVPKLWTRAGGKIIAITTARRLATANFAKKFMIYHGARPATASCELCFQGRKINPDFDHNVTRNGNLEQPHLRGIRTLDKAGSKNNCDYDR